MEYFQLNYDIDINIVHDFTGFYEGVFDINDGYIDVPKTVKIFLDNDNEFYVEFHPGDTLFFLNNEIIGSTGPHYQIRKIPFLSFLNYSKRLSNVEKLLLLPMADIRGYDTSNMRAGIYITEAQNLDVELLKLAL